MTKQLTHDPEDDQTTYKSIDSGKISIFDFKDSCMWSIIVDRALTKSLGSSKSNIVPLVTGHKERTLVLRDWQMKSKDGIVNNIFGILTFSNLWMKNEEMYCSGMR